MKYGFVKIGAATPEIKVADAAFNAESIISLIDEADGKGVELLVFPELCITGYTCGDLVFSGVLLDGAEAALKEIAASTAGKRMLVFVGLPLKKGNLIYNVAAAICDGKVLAFVPKRYIPNYGEFYEKRYYAPCPEEISERIFDGYAVPFGNKIIFCEAQMKEFTVCAEVCEDIWVPVSPSAYHAQAGAAITVNLSASDEVIGKADYRRSLVSIQSGKIVSAYVYADAGDGESTTDMVFAGHNVIAENGRILKESELFSKGLITAETDVKYLFGERAKLFNHGFNGDLGYVRVPFNAYRNSEDISREYARTPFVPEAGAERASRAEFILSMQAKGLEKRLKHTGAKCAVIGLSGGLDSTLALLATAEAMKRSGRSMKDVLTVTMPCFGTTSRTYENAVKLAHAVGATLKKVDITKSVKRHLKDIKHKEGVYDVAFENAQARERTQVLMDIANMEGGLVVGTGDLSELALGWATYNGDHMSMYGINCSVPKTLVRHIVEYYASKSKGRLKSVLLDILSTPVSPELLPAENDDISQKTEDIVGPYILHDYFLYYYARMGYSPEKIFFLAKRSFKGAFEEQTIKKWLKVFVKRFFGQQYKRSCVPDGVKVGSVTLSPRGDLRMPSDAEVALWLKQLD